MTEKDYKHFSITTDAEKKRFANRTIGLLTGIVWPGIESFSGEFGSFWRVAHVDDAPQAFKCYTAGKEKGIVT
jgi:hypothetical protein